MAAEPSQVSKDVIDSERRYRSLFENMNAGFVLFEAVLDSAGTAMDLLILAANKEFAATTGLQLEDAIGKLLSVALPGIADDEADWIGVYGRVALTGEPAHFEQGSELLGFYYSVSAFRPAPGQCAVTFLDVTESRRAQEELKISEARFRRIFESGAAGMVIAGQDLRFRKANRAFSHMTGFTEAELTEMTFLDVTHPDDVARDVPNVEGMLAGDLDYYRTEKRYLRKDGQPFWGQLTVSPIHDADGQFLYFVGIIVDIDERKQAEETLKAYAERLRNLRRMDKAILEGTESPASIAHVAVSNLRELFQCECVSVGVFDFGRNEAEVLAAVAGVDSSVKAGGRLPQEFYGDLAALRRNELSIVDDAGDGGPTSASHWVGAGESAGIRSSISAPIVSHGELIGALNAGWAAPGAVSENEMQIAREVAGQLSIALEQARLLRETQRHANDLEATVRYRTAQLEAANKELEAFSYSVSHDLRAPLRHISGYLDMLKDQFPEDLPEKAEHYMDVVTEAAQQMGVLIDDLLEFSRTGRQELRQADVDMNGALREAIDEFAPETEGREIAWSLADLPHIFGDHSLIKRVWVNLLGNAIKYTKYKDSAEIEVGFAEEPDSYVFHVRDNGAGFDMEYADKLFGVFQRLHSVAQFPGTGIGLANVQRIIHKHGGRVWAEGKPDEGATFYFSLPREPSDAGGNS